MTRLKPLWIVAAAAALSAAACGHDEPSPPPPAVSGQDFLPFYYDVLTGHTVSGDDECPPADDLHTLLIPCDTQDAP